MVVSQLPIAGSSQNESSSLSFLGLLSGEKLLSEVLHQSVGGLAAR